MITEELQTHKNTIDYSFYEKVFDLQILVSKKSKERDDLQKILISIRKHPSEVLIGYPSILIKTHGNLDPKHIQFYCYEPGKTFWRKIELDDAVVFVLNFAKDNELQILDRRKIDDLVIKALYLEAERLQIPDEVVKSGEV